MSNVEKFEQIRTEAADALFEEHNKEKSKRLTNNAYDFAEANFTEADFDEWIETLYGHEKFDMKLWKKQVLQDRALKAKAEDKKYKQVNY